MALAFTLLGVKEDKTVNHRGGWVFRVQGELCHLIGSLIPTDGEPPSYAQLYIYDPQFALQQRVNRNDKLPVSTMKSLQTMLLESHRYSREFKHAYEILNNHRGGTSDAQIRLRVMPGQDTRRYNLPTSDEMAVILPGDGSAQERRDIILRLRADEHLYARIDDGHPAYSPLHYVLLFPNGDHGWHRDIYHSPQHVHSRSASRNHRRVTQTEYSAFRLHTREAEYSTIHRGGRLFQQYVVDMWASADQTRLAFLHFNQRHLRASLYSGLEDWLRPDELGNPQDLGQRVVLTSVDLAINSSDIKMR